MQQKPADWPDSGDFILKLARVVKERRRSLGLTQSKAALLAGCDARFIRDLEHAKRTLRIDKVLDVLSALGLRLGVLNR